MSFTFAGRLRSLFSPFSRTFHNSALLKPVPPPRGDITTPESFLKAIGRGSETKVSFDTWDALWKTDGLALKKAGVAVRDRRYILWALERYRQQDDPSDYAHEAKPKKKIRGHGPAVQFGKRIRSRRRK
ncbi:IGR protein motif-domain-containing protein [Lactifluus subvellereus]|nr:IGR protein motif-domain-containing protein [Lactifluus subvellereus]